MNERNKSNTVLPKIVQFTLHLFSFKTPALRAVMSGESDADCASSMRNGVKSTDTLELTQKFNETFFTPFHIEDKKSNRLRNVNRFNENWFENTRKSIYITQFLFMKHDIKNYRPLTEIQISQLDTLTEEEKIEIIKAFNTMFSSYKQNVIV